MKKRVSLNRVLLLCLLASLFIFNTCKDDKEDNADNSYRVVQWNYLTDNVIDGNAFFTYKGEKITKITYNDNEYGESSKTEVDYPEDNSAILIDYYEEEGVWQEDYKQEMEFQNENVTQNIYYEYFVGIWEPTSKYTYQYNGSNLAEVIIYDYQDGNWVPGMKTTYEYEGDKLVLSMSYLFSEAWELYGKQEISYNGDNKNVEIIYIYNEGSFTEYLKREFNYDGNFLMSIDMYYYEDGMWVPYGEYMSFTYDSHGNVATWNEPGEGFFNIQFLYEEGKGNIRQIYFQGAGLFGDILPLPTKSAPEDQNHKRPEKIYPSFMN